MKRYVNRGIAILVLLLYLILSAAEAAAQDGVERKGNTFIVSSKGYTKTDYILYDKETGKTDTIYVSSKGAYFVFKTSKNGKRYRRYLKEITRQLNPGYYEKSKAKSD